ncbi:GerMN domain-containing protein [Modestobacter sp. SSW1-42]|uniref:GerMN domain-containing protein n=1 Tax=Modestobacter sp. SSW1-42 TaxID=596372 RepID=UPI0039886919
MTARRTAARAGALLVLLATAACGVPTGGDPEAIPATEVPYGLALPSPGATAAPTSPAGLGEPRVYLVAGDGALVPQGRAASAGTLAERLATLLADLATGPTPAELTERLSTALRPETSLSVAGVSGSTATIDLGGSAEAPSGRESKTAVAQIVLTATSLPGVDQVLVTRDGEQVEAPLPSGELTARPLTAADYAPLTVAAPPS